MSFMGLFGKEPTNSQKKETERKRQRHSALPF